MWIYAVILAILSSVGSSCPRVRANADPAVASFIEEASHTSSTFRQLVTQINRTNGLVCAGPYRIVHILLELRRELSELICSLGHEFQDALAAARARRGHP